MKQFWVVLLLSCSLYIHQTDSREVTNEDIRDAMLSLVHMVRAGEDKLERHEYRERQLGEQLKKALAGLDKKHRALEPMKGTLGRLDERLASVETILIQKDERERIQLQKTQMAIDDIRDSLRTWMTSMETVIRQISEPKVIEEPPKIDTRVSEVTSEDYEQLLSHQKELATKVDGVLSKVNQIENEVSKVHNESMKIKQLNEKSAKNLDQVEGQLKNSEQLLVKYENRLAELNNKIPVIQPKEEEDWHGIFLTALETQRDHLQKIATDVKGVESKIQIKPELPDNSAQHNTTMETLQELRYEIAAKTEKTAVKIDARLKEIEEKLIENQLNLIKSVTEIGEMSENVHSDVAKSYEHLRGEVQALGKMEKVMIQTADNVLDTKRRIEYGIHQILLEVGDIIKIQSKDINTTLNSRFDNIELTILDNQTGALANLSSKLEQEMSQVWRQIGIMYQELTASTTALDRLQEQTETYVNGSLSTMDSMEGKVGQITGRMAEVDENLNYLLGRLSLVTQEFNQIKTGLGAALDNIRSSFQTVQDKIKDSGPGPHKIEPDPEKK